MKVRQIVCAVAAVAMVVTFASCAKKEVGTIKIGVAGAHSGDLASYGLPTVNAAQLVIDEVNANGGIKGRQLELVVADDQCKPELATNVAANW